MYNKPILFVNSISIEEVGKENQNYFDSRKSFKGKGWKFHTRISRNRVWKMLYVSTKNNE